MKKNSDMSMIEQYKQELMKYYSRSTTPQRYSAPVKTASATPKTSYIDYDELSTEQHKDMVSERQRLMMMDTVSAMATLITPVIPELDVGEAPVAPIPTKPTPVTPVPSPNPSPSFPVIPLPPIVRPPVKPTPPTEDTEQPPVSLEVYGSEYGFLTSTVTVANNALPLADALVTIYIANNSGVSEFGRLLTDESGKTATVALPAPPIENSVMPISDLPAYESYTVRCDMEGYYSIIDMNVPVFRGVLSLQGFNMTPLPESMDEAMPIVLSRNIQNTLR